LELQARNWLLTFLKRVKAINSREKVRLLNGTVRPLDFDRFYGRRGAETEVRAGIV
jgi:hypothetical protein